MKYLATIVALVASLTFVSMAQAQGPMYDSSTYLHISNATNFCKHWNAGAADHTMMGSVGRHINPPSWPDTYPERGYYRFNNNYVYIAITYSSRTDSDGIPQWRVNYGCSISGTDQSPIMNGIAQESAVYRWR